MTSPEVELRRAWHRAVGRRDDDTIDALLARHREPHRRYHTAAHVMWVCRHVDQLAAAHPVADPDVVRVAALFHDAIYDPRATTNEHDSAVLADLRLAGLRARTGERDGHDPWPADRRAEVRRLIELTAGHEVGTDDLAGQVLLDADLAILGADANEYQHYATAVRAEYAHVDDVGWRSGRSRVLQHFLGRDAIYVTPTMHAEREQRARANLTAELAALTAAGG